MCEQCITNPFYFGEPIPGYTLIRARRQGNDMPLYSWGLVECNDPTFIFEFNFHLDPESDEWNDGMWEVNNALYCHPIAGFELVRSCMKAGYSQKLSGIPFTEWLLRHLRDWLVKTAPTVDADPFPQIDPERKHDYSPWIAPTNETPTA